MDSLRAVHFYWEEHYDGIHRRSFNQQTLQASEPYLSYRIPKGMEAGPGFRCVVNFARRKEEGIILSVHEEDTSKLPYKILPIESLVDSFPWFTDEMLQTALWISSYYMCTLIDALRLFYIDKKLSAPVLPMCLNGQN